MTDPPGGAADHVSADFVFGTLATDDLRVAQLRATTAGLRVAHDLEPPDPGPGDAVLITATVGGSVHADRVACYYTTDGSEPAGDRGRATNGTVVTLDRAGVAWDTLTWAYTERWCGSIPAQASGTLVRYRVQAWLDDRLAGDDGPLGGGDGRGKGDGPLGGGDGPLGDDVRGEGTWATEPAGVVAGERPPGVAESDALVLGPDAPVLWPVPRRGTFAYHVDEDRVPDWLRDAVIYQVFIDRFATTGGTPFAEPETPGGFFGGTLRGVIEHVDHIASLGATCIWLSPLFPSPSHHGYDATDLRAVEPRLGTEDDLRTLVTAAHETGIRVILDFAANHVSSGHPAFQRAITDRDSAEAKWFTFTRWPDQYLTFFGVQDHPQVDCDEPGARDYMIGSARRWLDLGVDGFRCDYAQGPSHAFWSAFRAETRRVRADSITIGEVADTPALQRTYRGRLDGCLDFLLQQALRRFFAFGDMTATEFDTFLARHLRFFEGDFVMPSFLDNHDMNRFLWVVQGDTRRLRLAALCQFTLPHPPILYYGTEVGLSQERDIRYADGSGHPEEARLPMPWGDDQDRALLAFFRRLVALRAAHPGVWREGRTTIARDDATGVYAYRCTNGSEDAIVALNNGDGSVELDIDPGTGWELVFATEDGAAVERGTMSLPARSGAVCMPFGTGRSDVAG